MARSISVDLRQRVFAATEEGLSCREAAARFKVSASREIRWRSQVRKTGCLTPHAQGGNRRPARIDAHADFVLAEVEATSDVTLAERQEKLSARGVPVGIGSLWRFFDRRRITRMRSSARSSDDPRANVVRQDNRAGLPLARGRRAYSHDSAFESHQDPIAP